MKKILLLILIVFVSLFKGLSAQTTLDTAVNFHVKTIDGDAIWLFDILDNDNKIVVIDFFSTSCGSCQLYAPDFQASYEDFGSNSSNVYYMGINWGADNQAVRTFDSTYNLTYPTVSGTQGGGNGVFTDYNILSYPTVIVIVPKDHLIVNQEIVPPVRDSINQAVMAAGGIMVGISENSASLKEMRIFPNPVFNKTTVKLLLKKPASISVLVFDVLGRVKYRLPEKFFTQSNVEIPLDLSNLDNGVYYINVAYGRHHVTRKIIKAGL